MDISALHFKIILTVVLAALLLLGLTTQIDETALRTHDATLDRALGAFVLAKGLNAVISLLQGTELSFAPVGIGLTLTVGEVLDPLNDLVERFSWVMLLATVSLGVQKLLLEFSSMQLVTGGLALFLLLGASSVWMHSLRHPLLLTFLIRGGLVLLLMRFATIGFIALQTLAFDHLMATRYDTATQRLEETQKELEALNQSHRRTPEMAQSRAKSESWFADMFETPAAMLERARTQYHKTEEMLDLQTLRRSMDNIQSHMVDLITIFVVQTVLLPLLFVWLMLKLIGWTFNNRIEASAFYETLTGKKTLN